MGATGMAMGSNRGGDNTKSVQGGMNRHADTVTIHFKALMGHNHGYKA